jgi:hypothetical protein
VNSRGELRTDGFCVQGTRGGSSRGGNAGRKRTRDRARGEEAGEMVQPVASLQDITDRWTVKLIAVRALGRDRGFGSLGWSQRLRRKTV